MDTTAQTTPSPAARARARAAEFAPSAAETAALTAAAAEMLDGDDALEALDARRVFGEDSPVAHHCEAVGAALGIPATIPVLTALAFRGIGCADRVRLRIDDPNRATPWSCPMHVWLYGELPATGGKTSLLTAMGHPEVLGFAGAAKRAWRNVAATDAHRRKKAARVAASAKSEAEAIAAEALIESPRHMVPDMICDRTTVEDTRWTTLQSGYTTSILGEGKEGLERFVYTLAVNDLNDGFSGAHVDANTRKDRREGNQVMFGEMHMSLVWLPQPGSLTPTDLTARKNVIEAIGQKGFLARFLTARGEAGVVQPKGTRDHGELERIKTAYMLDLAGFLGGVKPVAVGEGVPLPGLDGHPLAPRSEHVTAASVEQVYAGRWVDITGEAAARLYEFQQRHKGIARELRLAAEARGQTIEPRSPTHGRIGEQAMRVAAVLALIRVGGLQHEVVSVTLDEAERAIYVCETLLPHAASMIREASMGEVAALVRRIVRVLASHGKMTEARLWSSHAQHWPEVAGWDGRARASITAALESAERYGLVDKGRSPGGKATYDLSPAARRAVVREVA